MNMVCLITGSSRGLGKAIALGCGAKGHQVAVHYRENKREAEDVSAQINEACVFHADVRNPDQVKALVHDVIKKWGRIDVLVNNAGITKESLLIRTSEQDFDDVMNTNLKGPMYLIHAAGQQMMKQRSGHIINISSYAGIKGREGLSAYAASKSALVGLTKTAAKELAGYNILVNTVLPGYMLTDMGSDSSKKAKEIALKENMVKDYSDPENVAEFICFLMQTKGISGQVFNLDSRII